MACSPHDLSIDADRLPRDSAPVIGCGSLTALSPELLSARERLAEPGRDRIGVAWIDLDDATGELADRRQVGGHDRCPAGHRLEHRQSESLVEGDVGRAACSPVKRSELIVRDFAEPTYAVALHGLDVTPAARADNAKLAAVQVCAPKAFDKPIEILTRLERRDGEHVIALGDIAGSRERRPDGVRNHPDLRFGNAEQVNELARGELRDRNDACRSVGNAWDKGPAVPSRPRIEGLRVPQDGEVVEGDDQRHTRAHGRAKRRAVENVRRAREQRQRTEVPAEIANRYGGATAERERMSLQRYIRRALELAEQAADVAGRSRSRLRQRARVERDFDHDLSVSEHAFVPAQDGFAASFPAELPSVPQAFRAPLRAVLERGFELLRDSLGTLRIGAEGCLAGCFVQRRVRGDNRGGTAREGFDDRYPEAFEP